MSTVTLISGSNPSVSGSWVVFFATVSPVVAGTISFYDGATLLGTATVDGSGNTTYTDTGLTVGSHSMTAVHSTAGSSPAVTQVVTSSGGGGGGGLDPDVTVLNWPTTQPISGSVSVSNFPATQPVSGSVTVSGTVTAAAPYSLGQQLAAASVPVVLTAAQLTTLTPLSSVSVSNFPATQPVSGTVAVTGTFWQATQPVSGTFFQATQPVSGTFWQATQPISGTVAVSGSVAVTGTFWQSTQPVSIASMPSTPVTGTFFQATQPVSLATLPALTAGSAVIGHVITDSGSTTAVTGTVTISGAVTEATLDAALIAQEATTSGVKGLTAFGAVTTNAPTYTTAKSDALSLDTSGLLRVSLKDTPANTNKFLVTADAITIAASQTVGLAAGSAVIGHVIVDTAPSTAVTNVGTFAVQATLAAETTKVIGTVNQGTSPWVTSTTLAAETTKVIGTVNVAASQTIAVTNTGTFATQSTLAAETTKIIGTVNVASSQTIGIAAGSAVIGHVIVDSGTVTAVTSITNAVTVTQATPASLQATVTPITLTKGTQGATGFSVQELKDAGRSYVTLYAQLITGVTTEALATFTKNVNGTATTAQTAYTITSGKTFRIQSLFVRVLNTTTVANNITVNIRAAASVSASSPIVFSCGASAPAAVSGVIGVFSGDIPDGMELTGNGTLQIGIGHVENVTTASIVSFTMTGYEY